MPTTHISKYPIVDPNPNLGRVMANFNFTDYVHISLFTVSGATFGYFGASKLLRNYNMKFLTGIGLMAGVCFAVESSAQRLLGLYPNKREVELYGVASQQVLDNYKKLSENPNFDLIDSNITKK